MRLQIITVFAALLATTSFAQIPTQGLVAYYPFNINANDSSGNGFDGVVNGQTLVGSLCSNGYEFHNNSIDCGDPADDSFDLVNNATIALWVKLLSTPSNYYTLIGKDVGAGNNNKKWFFAIKASGLTFHINGPGMVGGRWCYSENFQFALDAFYHVVITKNGNDYAFFLNSAPIGTDTLPLDVLDVPAALRIGKNENSPINAVLDEVLIYDRVLSQTEMEQLYTKCTVGILEAHGPPSFSVFPTPFHDRLNIDLVGLSRVVGIDIRNSLGVQVEALRTTGGSNTTWDGRTNSGAEVPPGMYLVTVLADGQRYTRRVIKQ